MTVSGSPIDVLSLIKQAKAGDAQAFGALYARYFDNIYRYVFFRTNHLEDAEDLTELIFLHAWEALPKYQDKGLLFISWLYRIAHNAVIDYHRRNKFTATIDVGDLDLLDRGPAALDQLIEHERRQQLSAAISRLPEDQQQVIVLRFIENLSYAEVAKIVGRTPGACRMIQYRALLNLSQMMKKD